MGNRLWRVLDKDNASNGEKNFAFLFSEDVLAANMEYDRFSTNIAWEKCSLRSYLNGSNNAGGEDTLLGKIFTALEREAIGALTNANPDTDFNRSGNGDTADLLFLLSLEDIENSNYGFTNYNRTRAAADGNYIPFWWWLRAPDSSDRFYKNVAYVTPWGMVYSDIYGAASKEGVRPAFNLDLDSVLFASEGRASKSLSFAPAGNAPESGERGYSIWNLTLKDHNGEFMASRTNIGDLSAGTDYNQISAMLVDDSNTVLAYGRISGNDGAKTGDYELIIPSGIGEASKLYVFAEKVNSSDVLNLTDYACDMVEVSAVKSNASAPVITTPKEETPKPLGWEESKVAIEQQGPLCRAAFRAASPMEYHEAFSFNLLLEEKATYDRKAGKYVLHIPVEYQKADRTFALIGVEKEGNTKLFTDSDNSNETITIDNLEIGGYAFLLIYTDQTRTSAASAGLP